jgi:hypothetical protein
MVFEAFLAASAFRIIASLTVLRWAFAGGLIAVGADLTDKVLINLIDIGFMRHYQVWDKVIDQVYMLAFLLVAWSWGGLARNVSVALFIFRIPGVVLFELTKVREVLLIFPNVFEFWFVFMAGLYHYRPGYELSRQRAALIVGFLTIPKLFQEWFLHWYRWLDTLNAIEFLELLWEIASWPFGMVGLVAPH